MAKLVFGLMQSLDGYVNHTHAQMRPGLCSLDTSWSMCAS